jgi:hypothetical protein
VRKWAQPDTRTSRSVPLDQPRTQNRGPTQGDRTVGVARLHCRDHRPGGEPPNRREHGVRLRAPVLGSPTRLGYVQDQQSRVMHRQDRALGPRPPFRWRTRRTAIGLTLEVGGRESTCPGALWHRNGVMQSSGFPGAAGGPGARRRAQAGLALGTAGAAVAAGRGRGRLAETAWLGAGSARGKGTGWSSR